MHVHHSVSGGSLVASSFAVSSLGSFRAPMNTQTFPLHPLFEPFFCGDWRHLDKLFASPKFLLGLYPLGRLVVDCRTKKQLICMTFEEQDVFGSTLDPIFKHATGGKSIALPYFCFLP